MRPDEAEDDARVRPPAVGEMMKAPQKRRRASRGWYLLLLIQFVAVLWPPFYNRDEPRLGGLPFFYWYQLLWVMIAALLTAIVYWMTEDSR